jgi:hypothetical protein
VDVLFRRIQITSDKIKHSYWTSKKDNKDIQIIGMFIGVMSIIVSSLTYQHCVQQLKSDGSR